jgi:hypothetical protein
VLVMFFILLILGMTVAGGMLTRQNFTNFRSHDREVKARYASHAALQSGLHHLSNDSTWAPTESNPHVEYLDAPTNSVGFKVWLEGVNRNSLVPVVTPSGQTLTKGQAIMRVTALVDGQSEGGFLGGADSLRLQQPKVPYSFSMVQGDQQAEQGWLYSEYTNYLSYSSNPLGPIAPVDFSWDPSKPMWKDLSAPSYWDLQNLRPVPPQNQRGGLRETDNRTVVRAHRYTRIYSSHSLTTAASAIVSFAWGCVAPLPAARVIDNTPWISIRFDYPVSMRGVTGANFSGGGALAPGFYSEVIIPSGQTLVLERGASYGIERLLLEDGANIVLAGTSTDPCLVYYKVFGINSGSDATLTGSRINMPADGTAPVPWDLHFLGVKDSQVVTVAAQVAAIVIADDQFQSWNSDFYGTVVTRCVSGFNLRSNFHFDEAIRDREAPVEPNWILVSQARNR